MSGVPVPQGRYVPATRFGDMVFTAGMTPRKDGRLIMSGKVRISDDLEGYREAVRLAASNALAAARGALGEGEKIARVLSLTVYVNAEEGFTSHAAFADMASEYFLEELGEAGIAARTSVGAASLPGNAPCEIQLTAAAG